MPESKNSPIQIALPCFGPEEEGAWGGRGTHQSLINPQRIASCACAWLNLFLQWEAPAGMAEPEDGWKEGTKLACLWEESEWSE